MSDVTWKQLIEEEMEDNQDTWDDVVDWKTDIDKDSTSWWDIEFSSSFGIAEGNPFLLWTKRFVYFPVVYDGSEWVGSVPIKKGYSNRKLTHYGGG